MRGRAGESEGGRERGREIEREGEVAACASQCVRPVCSEIEIGAGEGVV